MGYVIWQQRTIKIGSFLRFIVYGVWFMGKALSLDGEKAWC